jgi:aryl sulfotransferase
MYGVFNDPDRPGPEFPRCPSTPRELWPRWISDGWFEWEPDGWPFWSHHHHLSTWWQVRELSNVLFVHYGDLNADPETEIRRIAAFCDTEIDEDSWPALIACVGLDAMRSEARGSENPMSMVWEGGADRFFFKGDSGRWRGVLTAEDLALYEIAASSLDATLRRWLEGGRHAVGPAV